MKDRVSIIIVYGDGRKPIRLSFRKVYLKVFAVLAILSLFSYLSNILLIKHAVDLRGRVALLEESVVLREKQLFRKEHTNNLLKAKINTLEGKLKVVESYLVKRGVLQKSAVGGLSARGPEDTVKLLDSYIKRAEKVEKVLNFIPLGYPAYGEITSHFGWRKNPFGKGYEFHTGMDIKVPYGHPVRATANGVVEYVGRLGGYGIVVVLDHGNGYKTLYGHLSKAEVSASSRVSAGAVIGRAGNTGRSTGSHVHYEVMKGSVSVDPKDYLSLEAE